MALATVSALVALEALRGGVETGGLLVNLEPVFGMAIFPLMAVRTTRATVALGASGFSTCNGTPLHFVPDYKLLGMGLPPVAGVRGGLARLVAGGAIRLGVATPTRGGRSAVRNAATARRCGMRLFREAARVRHL